MSRRSATAKRGERGGGFNLWMEKLGSAKMILYESLESDELLELDRVSLDWKFFVQMNMLQIFWSSCSNFTVRLLSLCEMKFQIVLRYTCRSELTKTGVCVLPRIFHLGNQFRLWIPHLHHQYSWSWTPRLDSRRCETRSYTSCYCYDQDQRYPSMMVNSASTFPRQRSVHPEVFRTKGTIVSALQLQDSPAGPFVPQPDPLACPIDQEGAIEYIDLWLAKSVRMLI